MVPVTNAAGTGYTDNFRLAENGNVGVGVNPTQRFHVAGNSYLQGTLYLGNTDTALFTILPIELRRMISFM